MSKGFPLRRRGGLPALAALVLQNTSLVLCLKLSFRERGASYAPSTVVLVSEFIKLLLCAIVILKDRPGDLRAIVQQISRQWLLFVPSILYVLQNNLLFFGAERLSSLMYILCSQMKILTTAVMSRMIIGTRLTVAQYVYLVFLVFGVVTVQFQGVKVAPSSASQVASNTTWGVLAVILASWISGTAGVTLEKIFTAAGSTSDKVAHSVWTRNLQMSIVSIPFAFSGVCINNSELLVTRELFKGYTPVVWAVVFLQSAGGIITAFVMKSAGNIMKCLAIALSICCCATFSVLQRESELTPALLLGVFSVCISVSGYSLSTKPILRPKLTPDKILMQRSAV